MATAPEERAAPRRGAARADRYLTVSLGGDQVGIPAARVREIIECGAIEWLSVGRGGVRGTVNVRGKPVPVLDLAVRFGRPPLLLERRSCIVIAEIDGGRLQRFRNLGLLVAAVHEVVDVIPEMFESAQGSLGDLVCGRGRVRNEPVLLLCVDAMAAELKKFGMAEAGLIGGGESA